MQSQILESNQNIPLRILMVSDFFHPNTGGVENHIYQLSQCLIARGHKVVILTHAYGDIQGIKYLTNALKVYYIPRLPFVQSDTFPTILGSFPWLYKIILTEDINLVHAHQAFSTLAHEAILHARTMNLRVVFTDHSLFGFADASSILVNKVMKFSLADIHAAICVSHTSKENTVLRACIPPQRVYVIPNAVDTQKFYPKDRQICDGDGKNQLENSTRNIINDQTTTTTTTTTKNNNNNKSNNNNNRIVIVVMSRLVYRKGIDLLAAILPVLCQKYPHLHIIIGGDGPKRPLLESVIHHANISHQVELVGAVPYDQVRDLLVRGHIFLNCSLTEAFCMALVEAAAVGLCVVSSNVGGVPEVLPSDILILADPSPEGVVNAVDGAIDKVKSILGEKSGGGVDGADGSTIDKKMGCTRETILARKQHEKVASMYNWPSIAQRTERVYHDVVRMERDDCAAARLKRFYLCGKWFGKICCCIAAVDWLYYRILQMMYPKKKIYSAK